MRISGIIKVPERIARFFSMHSCLYLQVYMYRDGPKTDWSTVLGLFTSKSEGGVNVITTDVGLKGHMHRIRKTLIRLSTTWVKKTQNRTRQSNITVDSTSSRLPHIPPFCFWIRSIRSFSTTDYCVTLYKDASIASTWGPWVINQYWDWKTFWSQSSSRAIAVEHSQLIAVFCIYLGVFLLPMRADIHKSR